MSIGVETMRSDYANLHEHFVEVLHNPHISNKCYMIRLTGYTQERYEMMLSKDDLKGLADLLNKFLENE